MSSLVLSSVKFDDLARIAVLAAFTQILVFIPHAEAQQIHCEKYCHASCREYFPGPEFSDCVTSNVHCNCSSRISVRNPLWIFFIFVSIVLCCSGLAFCCRFCNFAGRHRQRPIVAEPVVSTVRNTNPRRSSRQGGYDNPVATPISSTNDVPPEYLPPPPYNDCTININSEKY